MGLERDHEDDVGPEGRVRGVGVPGRGEECSEVPTGCGSQPGRLSDQSLLCLL